MKVVKLTIEDVLDLHTFQPKDIPDLLEDYFAECLKAGIYWVRIIHGKGKGIQKRRVQGLLEKNSKVTAFKEASPKAGGWAPTLVELSRNLDIVDPKEHVLVNGEEVARDLDVRSLRKPRTPVRIGAFGTTTLRGPP